jgi:purine-binding chemotaxis protein CheW
VLEHGSSQLPPRELISFYIAGQDFCIDIMAVREIRGWTTATPLPHAPPVSRGVVNLRGAILPIVDLAALLGLPATATTKQNVIIVVEASSQTVGLLVDGVSDILTVTPEMVQPAPSIATGGGAANIGGLIEIEGRLLTLLNLGSLMAVLSGAMAA